MQVIRLALLHCSRASVASGLLAIGLTIKPITTHALSDYSRMRDSKGCPILKGGSAPKHCTLRNQRAINAPTPKISPQFRATWHVPPEVLNLQLTPPGTQQRQ
jgi:hypothetical protein